MKVAILAADMVSTTNHPKSLSSTVGKVSLIEYNIRILNLLNINNADIFVVTRSNLDARDNVILDQIDKFQINQIKIDSEQKRSLSSFKKFLEKDIENTLILNGDRYFEFSNIEKIIFDKEVSTCLYENQNSFDRTYIELVGENGYLKEVMACSNNFFVPWKSYHGATYLTKRDL